MTILELMERSGTKETSLAIAWIKDAIHLIQSSTSERTKVVKYNVIDGERDYLIPQDLVAINLFRYMIQMIKSTKKLEELYKI